MAELKLNEAKTPRVGEQPWVRARMSYGDMFAFGAYATLGSLFVMIIVAIVLSIIGAIVVGLLAAVTS